MSELKTINLKKKIFTGAMWLTGLTLTGQFITWTVSIYVIRILKPEDYGLMAMATFFLGLCTIWSELGLGPAIIQKAEIAESELRKTFGCVILINVGLFCFVLSVAPIVALFFSEPRLVLILRAISINFLLFSFYFLPQSLLMRDLEFRIKSLIDLLANLCGSLILLSLALLGFGVWSLVTSIISINLFKAIVFNTQRRYLQWPTFSLSGMRDLVTFGGHVTMTRILWYLYSQADIAIGGRVFGKELLGIYSVAMQLVSLPIAKVSQLFTQIGLPAFSQIQDDLGKIQENFLKLLRMLNFVSFPTFIGLAIVAPDAIPLLLGPAWEEIILPIQILCFAMPLRFITTLFPPIITGCGCPEVITRNMVFAIIIMPIAFLMGSKWGMIGLCCSWVTAFPIVFIIMSKRVFRVLELPFKALLGTFIRPLLGTTVMALCLLFLKRMIIGLVPPLWSVMIIIATGIVFYSATVLVINRGALVEIRSIFSTR